MASTNRLRVVIGKLPVWNHVRPSNLHYNCSRALIQRSSFSSIRALLSDRKYTSDHEWIKNVDGIGIVGITDYAQDKLGDVVYVQLPEVDDEFSAGETFGALESVKAASDLISPVTGTVTEANEALTDSPGLINSSPQEHGWIVKLKLSDPKEIDSLMSEEEYNKFKQQDE